MDWATLQAGLPTLFGDLLGVRCQWRTQPVQMVQGASATIDVLGQVALGVDERTWADVEEDGEVVGVQATQHGLREMTLQITCWAPSQTLGNSARAALELLRLRLRMPSSLARLRALGLALVTIEPVVLGDVVQDMRARSQASMDVRVTYAVSEADEVIPYIERARVKSEHLENAGGAPLPASVQIDLNPPAPEP